jgi:hypothetical protein
MSRELRKKKEILSMKKFKVVCFTLLAASAIASTFYFTTAKAANSKNPDTIIETEEASTEEQPSILPQNDKSPSTHV